MCIAEKTENRAFYLTPFWVENSQKFHDFDKNPRNHVEVMSSSRCCYFLCKIGFVLGFLPFESKTIYAQGERLKMAFALNIFSSASILGVNW